MQLSKKTRKYYIILLYYCNSDKLKI